MRSTIVMLFLFAGCTASTTGERELLVSGYGALTTACRVADAKEVLQAAGDARAVLRAMRPLLQQIDEAEGDQRSKLIVAYEVMREKLAAKVRDVAGELRKAGHEPLSDALYGYATVLGFGEVSELVLSEADKELTELLGE